MTTNLSDCDAPAGGFDREDVTLEIKDVALSGTAGVVQLQSDGTSTRVLPALSATWRVPDNPYITGVQFAYTPTGGGGETIMSSAQQPGAAAWKTTQSIVGGMTYTVRYRAVGVASTFGAWSDPEDILIAQDVGPYQGEGPPAFVAPLGSTYQRQDVSQQYRYVDAASLGSLSLTNPGAEAGSASGWTATTGTVTVSTNYAGQVLPRTGSYMLSCLGGGPSVIFHQDLAIPGGSEADIDAGLVSVSGIGGYHNPGIPHPGGTVNDRARLFVAFLDGSNAVIGSPVYTGWNAIDSTWTWMSPGDLTLPVGTRSIRIGTENEPEDATHDNFWDDFAASVDLSRVAGWQLMSDLSSVSVNGAEVDTALTGLNVAGDIVSGSTDGGGTVTVTINSSNDPTLAGASANKAVTEQAAKAYVDNRVNGLNWKRAARAGTTANISLSGAQTIDGVSVVAGDRVLVKNQSTGSQNGIYDAASGAWTRSADADTGAELVNATCYISEGTTQADTQWTCSTNATITVGSTTVTFVQSGGTSGTIGGSTGGTDKAVLVANGTGGSTLQATPLLINPSTGLITFPDGVRQVFNPDATNAGLNTGAQAGDPSSLTDGDIWYNSVSAALKARINGVSVVLSGGGPTGGLLASYLTGSVPTSANTGFTTWVNQGTATITDNTIGLTLADMGFAGGTPVNLRMRKQNVPGTPWTKTFLFQMLPRAGAQFQYSGVAFTDGTKFQTFGLSMGSAAGGGGILVVDNWSNTTTYVSTAAGGSMLNGIGGYIFLRLADSGTNVTFSYSFDGQTFMTFYTVAKSSGYLGSGGYSAYGLVLDARGSGIAETLLAFY